MRIRQTLQLSAAVSLASLVLLAAAIVGIQHRESQYAAASENMNGAVRTISLMRGLPHDLTGEWHLRATQQWKIQHANLTRTLDTIPTVNADAHALKLRLRDDNAAIATFFAALSSARPNMRPKEALLLIAAQLDVRTASMASDILTMDDMTAAYFDRQKQWLRFMTVVLIVILAGIIGGLLWILYSRVIVPIVMLGNASAIVSAGQLDQPILVTGSNEVTTLARSFETMRVSLQDRMRDLDAEIRKLRDSEQRLRLNEANLAITLNSIGDAVIATDAQGCITRMNPVAERFTGWPLADALGQPLTAVFHIISAETRLPSIDPVQRVMEHGEVVGLANHTVLLARGGNEYQIADSAAPIRDATDTIVGVVLVFSDVTEKYRLDQTLQQRLREIEQIYAYSPIGLFSFDREYRFVRINERMAGINGYSVAEHDGKTLDEIVPDLAAFLKQTYRPVFERGEPVLNVEIHGKTPHDPDHEHYWIGNYFPMKSETGEVVGLIGAVFEITERKQAEKALRESEQHFEAMVQAMSDVIYRMSADWSAMHPLDGHALVASNDKPLAGWAWLEQNIPADEHARIRQAIGVAIAQKAVFSLEHRVLRPDGTIGWTASRAVPILDAQGNLREWFGAASDISARKRAEAMQLEMQGQLAQARKMESIGQLTAGIAHDFNNMLGAIMGYTELSQHMLTAGKAEAIAPYQAEILKSSNRAKELIQQMLIFSRASSGDSDGQAPVIELTPVIKEVVSFARPSIPSTIDIKLQIDNEHLKALIRPVNLHQILLNLIVNARDAMGEYGKINVTLSQHNYEHKLCQSCQMPVSGDFAKITVQDSGTGIPPYVLSKIFDPFFTTKEVGKGTGMGLSVVHGLVHSQGGHIYVETSPDTGTAISILLPLKSENASVEILSGSTAVSNIKGIRIMVVDDEPVLAGMLDDYLSTFGAKITVFSESIKALESFIQHGDQIDLVITDETMPGMSGMLLAEKLLKLKPSLPIILCTGYSDHASPESALKIGIAGFFQKPMNLNELMVKIQELSKSKA